MTILCDTEIKDLRPFRPWDESLVQPASCEVTLGNEFIDGNRTITAREPFEMFPGDFLLATTVETIYVPANLVAQVNGKSSWARRGLIIHTTAGFIDPGFTGQITLELANLSRKPVTLYPGCRIAQVVFTRMSQPAERPYGSEGLGSHYQNQTGVTGARWQPSKA